MISLYFSEDYLRSKLLRSASEDGLNIPSTPEFSFDGNLEGSGGTQYRRQASRIVSPTSPPSESGSSYHGSARYVTIGVVCKITNMILTFK